MGRGCLPVEQPAPFQLITAKQPVISEHGCMAVLVGSLPSWEHAPFLSVLVRCSTFSCDSEQAVPFPWLRLLIC